MSDAGKTPDWNPALLFEGPALRARSEEACRRAREAREKARRMMNEWWRICGRLDVQRDGAGDVNASVAAPDLAPARRPSR